MQPKKAGFSRQKRLLTPEDYKRVFVEPFRSTSSYFKVLARTNAKTIARLGVIVSKKALKHAVERNRVKRLIRESFRIDQNKLVGLDVVVLLRQDVMKNKQGHSLSPQNCLSRHWNELNTICKKD